MSNENDIELEVNTDEQMEEAHDPKNASKDSAKLVDKGTEVTKRAGGRKGDKRNSMPMDTAAKAKAISKRIGQMSDYGIDKAYKNMFGEGFEEDFLNDIEEATFDHAEELKSLVESEATLSEEFKEKTAVLFETALADKVSRIESELEEAHAQALAEELDNVSEEIVDKVDSYLNYVVENWMEENALAVETGLRTEIAEEFMDGLKTLFAESYIEVPEEKVDLVDELAEKIEELEESLNETTLDAIALSEANEELVRERVLFEASHNLADTDAARLESLVENIDFDDEESFAAKVEIVKESHFTNKSKSGEVLEEAVNEEGTSEITSDPAVAAAVAALRRQQ